VVKGRLEALVRRACVTKGLVIQNPKGRGGQAGVWRGWEAGKAEIFMEVIVAE